MYVRIYSVMIGAVILAGVLVMPAWGLDTIYGPADDTCAQKQIEQPEIDAPIALIGTKDGDIYYERDALNKVKIASLTKIMTFLVARTYDTKIDEVIVTSEAADIGESSADLKAGDILSWEDAYKSMLVSSGNDAAYAIAYTVGTKALGAAPDKAVDTFVKEMNVYARKHGFTSSLFTNPHGLDEDEFESDAHSSARDVADMVSLAMQDDLFRTIVASKDATITPKDNHGKTRTIKINSTNILLGKDNENIGVKTGTTNLAGYCFAGAYLLYDTEFYTVVLQNETSDARFDDSQELIAWLKRHMKDVDLIQTTEHNEADVPVVAEIPHLDWSGKNVDATVEDPDSVITFFEYGGKIEQHLYALELHGDIKKGDEIGIIEFKQNGKLIEQRTLYALEDVSAPNIFQRLGVAIDRLVRKFMNEPSTMPITCYNNINELNVNQK